MIDLHMHSNYSDGSCSPEELIENAKSLGLTQIAITDHNILDGALSIKDSKDVDLIIGTELSCDYNNVEIHLLSYFPNYSNYKNVKFIINEGETLKKIAIMEMIENLNNMGFAIELSELREFSQGIINRVHICRAMMKHGYINSVAEGFEKYVGDNCPAFVERKKISLLDAIDAVHEDGGIAIIAHPYEYEFSSIDTFLNEVIDKVDGIECFHPSASSEESKHLVEFTKRHQKLITGGSDFHGINKPDIQMGMMNVDDIYSLKRNK